MQKQNICSTQWWVIKQTKHDSNAVCTTVATWPTSVRVEECWSLSNVEYGPRTRRVILAHKPLLFSVIFPFTVFVTTRGSFGVGECAALIDAAIEFDSCYILQGEPWSIRWEAGQGYIKGIPVNPRLSAAQDPSLCFSLPDRCPSHCFFWACFSEWKPDPTGCQCHQWPPVLACHSIPSLLLSGMHFSHSFLSSLPLFSGPRCPRQSGGSVCLVVPDLFILSGETGYSDLLCVRWSPSQAPVW